MSDIEKGNAIRTVENGGGVAGATINYDQAPPVRMPGSTYGPHRLGNPGPLGLFAFASTTLVLSLFNVGARGITVPNAVVGMALFYGGLAQLLAGMWEFAVGNTFGATAFSSYGAFWISFAAFFVPASGIAAAYSAEEVAGQEGSAIGIYLLTWMTVTILFLLAALRKNIAFIFLFSFLSVTFMMLGTGELVSNKSTGANLHKAGGALGIITALIAYYIGLAEMLGPEDAFQLPIGRFAPRGRV